MPSYGEYQAPAGKKLKCGCKPLGTRTMVSRNPFITSTVRLDNIEYKGNAVLNANK